MRCRLFASLVVATVSSVLAGTVASAKDRPTANVLAGARYLRLLLDRLESPDPPLAAYNAGPTAVADGGGAPTAQTATYFANATGLWRALRACR